MLNTAKSLFDNRLDELRRFAENKRVHLAQVLQVTMNDGIAQAVGFGILFDKTLCADEKKCDTKVALE